MPFDKPVKDMRRPPQDSKGGKFSQKMSVKAGTATDTVRAKDVDDFDKQGLSGRPHVEYENVDPVHIISRYAELGEGLKKSFNFREVAQKMAEIADAAENTVVKEAGDWFDEHTIRRNMKEMKSYAQQFSKIAEDLDVMHQRATALFDDMGNVLSRYFELREAEAAEAHDDKFDRKTTGADNLEQPYAGPDRGAKDMGNAGQQGWTEQDDHLEADYEDRQSGTDEVVKEQEEDDEYTPGEGDIAQRLGKNIPEVGGFSSIYPNDAKRRPGESDEEWGKRKPKDEGRGLALPGSQDYKNNYKTTGVEEGDVGFRKNQLAIAQQAIKKPEALAKVMTGMTRDEAREIIKKYGATTVKEAKKAMAKEAINRLAQKLTEMNSRTVSPEQTVEAVHGPGGTKEVELRQIVQNKQMGKVEGQKIDLFSASAIVAVLDALNPENKAKFLSFPVLKMATIAYKLVK